MLRGPHCPLGTWARPSVQASPDSSLSMCLLAKVKGFPWERKSAWQALDSSIHPCISHEIQRAWFLYGGCLGADLFYFSLNDSYSRICAVNTDAHGLSPQGFLSASHTHSAMLLHFGSLLPVDCQQLDLFYVISLSVSDRGWWKGSLIQGRLCVTLD